MTNSQRILELIHKNPDGLDDDEISDLTGIQPRQQVYQICTRLEASGHIKRESIEKPGKRRKIHNFAVEVGFQASDQHHESQKWEQRLNALMAATGKSKNALLDEALQNLAIKVLKAQGEA